jgi:hypothetical protein
MMTMRSSRESAQVTAMMNPTLIITPGLFTHIGTMATHTNSTKNYTNVVYKNQEEHED